MAAAQQNNKIELNFAELFLRNDFIVQINIYENQEITKENVEILVNETIRLTNNIPHPVIIYVGEFTTFTEDARQFSASQDGKRACTAEAFIINNLGHKIIANFYLTVNKPVKPVKFFEHEENAINWLTNINALIK